MASGNFDACLAVTLKWEGGYSNNPDDPGGPTQKGIIQREYDAWRKKQGKPTQPVIDIADDELQAIYRGGYWDPAGCETLQSGVDLAVFDAAVNSGLSRGLAWLKSGKTVDGICDARLGFLQDLGRLWHVFGAGWRRRVEGIRAEGHTLAGNPCDSSEEPCQELHAGMSGTSVLILQNHLSRLGFSCGTLDGIFGEKTFGAVEKFQAARNLDTDGIAGPATMAALKNALSSQPSIQEQKS